MVTSATNFSRTGLSDWLVQRVSAIVLLAYSLFIFGIFVLYPELSFEQWSGIFSNNAVRLFSMMSVLALCGHAWIGMWTVGTDYLRSRTMGPKGDRLRSIYQSICLLAILAYLLWGIKILWGN